MEHNAIGGDPKKARRSYGLGRQFRLGRNKQFQYVYRRGKRTPGRLLALTYLRGRDLKVGFSVSGKVGGSVTRNRVRRLLKEDFRMIREDLRLGKYVFSARDGCARASHQALTAEMRSVLSRADLFTRAERRV